jgi:uncharacterized RDD family membrane protein YckC
MTQPPDDRPRPDQPDGDVAPENEPTVAWTPPESEKPADEGGVGYAAIPDEGAVPPAAEPPAAPPEAVPPAPPPAAEPPAPQPAAEPPEAVPPPPPPTSPIISATPTPPATGWQAPDQPPAPPVAPGSGWEVPTAAPPLPQQEGYVIAGIGARFMAWLLDVTISGIIPAVLTFLLIDWVGIMREAFEAARLDPTGQSFNATDFTIPITTNFILVTLIGLGIQYLYFVGFWTSRWQGTPSMIGLKMRVVDATTGTTLSIVQATKRWILLGWPLSLLTLVPSLQSLQGTILLAVWIIVFFTTVTNDRRQGLHDRFANSLVIRSVRSGNGATFAGCLVWGVLVILFLFAIWAVIFAAIASLPEFQEYIEGLPTNSI